MPLSVFSLLFFFSFAFAAADISFAESDCNLSINPTVEWIFQRLSLSADVSLVEPICPIKTKINGVEPADLFLTNGLSRGEKVVCISDDISNPCKFVVGSFDPQADPVLTLKAAFDYKETIDLSSPIEESIERLLIRPADVIYPNKEKVRDRPN